MNLLALFRKPKRFFTSDLHFGHNNVINYCKRPYKDVLEMEEALVKSWNQTVAKKDTVYILGDFSLNPKWAKLLMPKLNGKKILVAGNHDACFVGHKKSAKFVQKYKEQCSEVYPHQSSIILKDGTFAILCHLPYASDEGMKFDTRYSDLRLEDKGSYLLHGHLHGKYKKFKKMIDVGWDAHGKILSEDEVIVLLKDEREFIPAPLTEFYAERAKENLPGAD